MERLPGFRDFYPEPLPHRDVWSCDLRNHIFDHWRQTARRYGFREYDGPPLEPLELFTVKSGEEIVNQLYNFEDKGGRQISLRPEMTPTVARMIAAHERNYKKPLKWFAIPQLFRYERQQKGRLREHFQFNADIFHDPDPALDSELIALLIDSLRSLGLSHEDFVIRLSSRQAWQKFYSDRCPSASGEYTFYQIIDKLERDPVAESETKLNQIGFSYTDVRAFIDAGQPGLELEAILQNLHARGMGQFVKVDYNVIRGLAYYTGVVFEAFDCKGDFRAIAGGGRYDNLVKLISGGKANVPAVGFGMGDVVLAELLRARGLLPAFSANIDGYCLIENEELRHDSLGCIQALRDKGFSIEYSYSPAKGDKQMKKAFELNARFAFKLEKKEGNLRVWLKNLVTREEKVLSHPEELAPALPFPASEKE